MQLAMNVEVIPRLKAASSFKVNLTERDYNIIEFVSNMKFVSIEDVFVKFFRITQKNTVASSMLWAEDRLQQLEKAGFLKSVRSFSEKCRFFIATPKSYFALANRYPERAIVKPLNMGSSATKIKTPATREEKKAALDVRLGNPKEVMNIMADFVRDGDIASLTDLISSYVTHSTKYKNLNEFAEAIGTSQATLCHFCLDACSNGQCQAGRLFRRQNVHHVSVSGSCKWLLYFFFSKKRFVRIYTKEQWHWISRLAVVGGIKCSG